MKLSEAEYQKLKQDIQRDIPIYPSLMREEALKRYRAEQQAELERKRREIEQRIAREQAERERRRRRRIRRERERKEKMMKEYRAGRGKPMGRIKLSGTWYKQVQTKYGILYIPESGAPTQRRPPIKPSQTHSGGMWVKIENGKVQMMGAAANPPDVARALGYKWGTVVWEHGKPTFVPLPNPPTKSEYLGMLQWKLERGDYPSRVAKQVRTEVEFGGKKYGITAPAWAGGRLKEFEATARKIRKAYEQAAKNVKKLIPADVPFSFSLGKQNELIATWTEPVKPKPKPQPQKQQQPKKKGYLSFEDIVIGSGKPLPSPTPARTTTTPKGWYEEASKPEPAIYRYKPTYESESWKPVITHGYDYLLKQEAKKEKRPLHKAILYLEAWKHGYKQKTDKEVLAVVPLRFAQNVLGPVALAETTVTEGPIASGKEFVESTVDWAKTTPEKYASGWYRPGDFLEVMTDIASMWTLGKAGAKAPKLAGKITEPVRYSGKTKIPAEELIPKYVIERERRFPMHRGSAGELFEKYKVESGKGVKAEVAQKLTTKPYLGFHTTPVAGGIRGLAKGFEVSTEATRSTDVPGMHIAARISPYFARFSEAKMYEIGPPGANLIKSLLNIGKRRGSLAIGFEEVRRLPRDVSKSVSKSRKFLIEEAERGTAYTTWKAERGLKRGAEIEEELVVSPLTQVKPIEKGGIISKLLGRDFEYYTEIWGKKLPIHRVEALKELGKVGKEAGRKAKGKKGKEIMTMEDYLSSFAKERGEVFELYPPSYSSYRGMKEYISRSTSKTTSEKRTGGRRYKEGYRGEKEYRKRSYISELEEGLERGRERSRTGGSYISSGGGSGYYRIISLIRPPVSCRRGRAPAPAPPRSWSKPSRAGGIARVPAALRTGRRRPCRPPSAPAPLPARLRLSCTCTLSPQPLL